MCRLWSSNDDDEEEEGESFERTFFGRVDAGHTNLITGAERRRKMHVVGPPADQVATHFFHAF